MYLCIDFCPEFQLKWKSWRIMLAFSCYHKIIAEHCLIKPNFQLHFKTHPGLTSLDCTWGNTAVLCRITHQKYPNVCRPDWSCFGYEIQDQKHRQELHLCCEIAGAELWGGSLQCTWECYGCMELALPMFHFSAHKTCLNILRKQETKQ